MSTFKYCFNTSTIRGQKLPLADVVKIAADAGYHAIEPWIDEIEEYRRQGGSLSDLKKQITDSGLTVESAVGFAEWIVDDGARRTAGLERARHEMDLVQQIGGAWIAAPPSGAQDTSLSDYKILSARYRALLELGEQIGVTPQLEIWGFSQTLHLLGQVLYVAAESRHPRACILPDIYHLYKGGSGFAGLQLLGPSAIHVFHMNDYPAMPRREEITDSDRVYPGDGIAPVRDVLQTLRHIGFDGYLSIELFNEAYWQQDPAAVAQTALAKLQSQIDG